MVRARVVIVTGASSGIGMQTAIRFAQQQARLVLCARNERALREVAARCRESGAAETVVHPADISQTPQVEELFEHAMAKFGRIDVVVNCAAVAAFGRFDDLPAAVFEQVLKTNVLGAANVARCSLARFKNQGAGALVVVGSLLGTTAVPYQSAYVASKFALNGLIRALRQENRRISGIKVHGVYPGPVETPVYHTAANYSPRTPRVPPAAYSPETIADAIVCAAGRRRSSERQVGVVNRPFIAIYRLLPWVFDAVITPLLHLTSFTAEPHRIATGNVFDHSG